VTWEQDEWLYEFSRTEPMISAHHMYPLQIFPHVNFAAAPILVPGNLGTRDYSTLLGVQADFI
jgi:hypothetical protein